MTQIADLPLETLCMIIQAAYDQSSHEEEEHVEGEEYIDPSILSTLGVSRQWRATTLDIFRLNMFTEDTIFQCYRDDFSRFEMRRILAGPGCYMSTLWAYRSCDQFSEDLQWQQEWALFGVYMKRMYLNGWKKRGWISRETPRNRVLYGWN